MCDALSYCHCPRKLIHNLKKNVIKKSVTLTWNASALKYAAAAACVLFILFRKHIFYINKLYK